MDVHCGSPCTLNFYDCACRLIEIGHPFWKRRMNNPKPAPVRPNSSGSAAPANAASRPGAKRVDSARGSRLALGIGLVVLMALCGSALVVSKIAMSPPLAPIDAASQVRDTGPRTAKVMRSSHNGNCAQMTFENASGRMLEADAPCTGGQADGDGKSPHRGTIDRLDRIQKSFQNR
jgi:hypothetical protein